MTRLIPGTSPNLAHAPMNPTCPAASDDWMAAPTHAPRRRSALPARVWPADIPCPAPANSPRLLRELKLLLVRHPEPQQV
ncbi:Crp/Fnr family transcriptional regulator, partial [Burkholderia cepacia]